MNGDDVIFSGTSGGVVTITGSIQPSSITVSATSGTYEFVSSAGNLLSGTTGLAKSGGGTLILSGPQTYSAPTTVQAGTLSLSGTLTGSPVTVQSGGTLAGNGFLGSTLTIQSSGTLAPGDSPGRITAMTLTLETGSTTVMEIVGVDSGTSSLPGTAGTDYDTLSAFASGGLTYGGTLSIVFSNTNSFANGTTFDLFQFTGATTGTFSSIATAGSGVYANLWFNRNADGSWSTADTGSHQYLKFNPITGDLVVVPEPSTWAAAVTGIVFATGLAGRRRARAHR